MVNEHTPPESPDKPAVDAATRLIAVKPAPPAGKPSKPKNPIHRIKAAAATAKENPLPPDAPFKLKLKHFLLEKITRKEFVIGSIVFVVLFASTLAVFGFSHLARAPQHTVAKTKPKPPAAVITSPLTGLPVTAAQAKKQITGVMIENSDFARPQSGLREAGVIFEGIAEAGITRFLALYQEATPKNMGPIRSVRPYFLQWDLGFDAPIAHVGGSPEALSDINKWHVKNLDEFYNGAYYHRISSREAPHNMYTSMAQLNALEKTKGWTTSHFIGFLRKKDSPAKTPTASTINFNISSSDFYVRYQYDPKANAYLRWEGSAAHIDATTGKQLEPKVVIGLVMPYSLESDGYHSDYDTIGSGKAYVFQDGTVTIGTWHKPNMTTNFTFTDATGKPIALNAGQTWLTALGSTSEVSYK